EAVDRPAFPGAVEIDQVQVGCSLGDPAAGHCRGISVKDRLLLIISLPQANALAAADVDGGVDLHEATPLIKTSEVSKTSEVLARKRGRDSHARELPQHRQSYRLAFLRVKLRRKDVLVPDRRGEWGGIV